MQFTESNKGSTIMRATEGQTFEPLVKTLIERNAVGMIVAPAKARKSMMALNFVFSLLTKKPFLGFPVSDKPEKIVYVNLELTHRALGIRLRTMNSFYNATPKQMENVVFLTSEEFCKNEALVDTKAQKVNQEPFIAIAEACKKWGATAIIFDPLYYIVGEENDNVLMTAVFREFGKLRNEANCAIVIVHHTGKGSIDWADPFLVGRGASSIGGALEFVLGIEPKPNDEARIHHGSRNYRSANPFPVNFNPLSLTWQSNFATNPDVQIDKIMGKDDELLLDAFYDRANMPKKLASELVKSAKKYEKTPAFRGQKATIKRKL